FVCGFFVIRNPEGDYVSDAVRGPRLTNLAPLVDDDELLWRNEPGARRRQPVNPSEFGHEDATWMIENNWEGFRGPERFTGGSHENLYRILCIGDSITFGFNVDQDAPFTRQLEALLRARYPSRQFEVINAGVPGWTWAQGVRFLELHGLALNPDLVIMAHGTNDQFYSVRVSDKAHLDARRREGPSSRSLRAMLARTNTYRVLRLVLQPPEESKDSAGCAEQTARLGSCHRVAIDEIEEHIHH